MAMGVKGCVVWVVLLCGTRIVVCILNHNVFDFFRLHIELHIPSLDIPKVRLTKAVLAVAEVLIASHRFHGVDCFPVDWLDRNCIGHFHGLAGRLVGPAQLLF